jgi:hypothetical protein
MLRNLRDNSPNNQYYGILSSHPAAIMAALRAFGYGLEGVDLRLIEKHAHDVMDASPVEYVKTAELNGSLFEQQTCFGRIESTGNAVSCAFTKFWVDHKKPDAVLEEVRKTRHWPLGENPEGCEYVVLIKRADHDASKTCQSSAHRESSPIGALTMCAGLY